MLMRRISFKVVYGIWLCMVVYGTVRTMTEIDNQHLQERGGEEADK